MSLAPSQPPPYSNTQASSGQTATNQVWQESSATNIENIVESGLQEAAESSGSIEPLAAIDEASGRDASARASNDQYKARRHRRRVDPGRVPGAHRRLAQPRIKPFHQDNGARVACNTRGTEAESDSLRAATNMNDELYIENTEFCFFPTSAWQFRDSGIPAVPASRVKEWALL